MIGTKDFFNVCEKQGYFKKSDFFDPIKRKSKEMRDYRLIATHILYEYALIWLSDLVWANSESYLDIKNDTLRHVRIEVKNDLGISRSTYYRYLKECVSRYSLDEEFRKKYTEIKSLFGTAIRLRIASFYNFYIIHKAVGGASHIAEI